MQVLCVHLGKSLDEFADDWEELDSEGNGAISLQQFKDYLRNHHSQNRTASMTVVDYGAVLSSLEGLTSELDDDDDDEAGASKTWHTVRMCNVTVRSPGCHEGYHGGR